MGFTTVQLANGKIPTSKVLCSHEIAPCAYEQPVEVVMGSGRFRINGAEEKALRRGTNASASGGRGTRMPTVSETKQLSRI